MKQQMIFMAFGTLLLAADALLSTDGLRFSARINDHDMKKVLGVNFGECYTECRLRADCQSFNFNRNYALCELLSVADANIANETGWIHKKMANENRSDLGLCSSISCPVGTVCREGQCKKDRCEPPRHINITNGEVFGNMNDIGSKILIVCNYGFVLFGQKQSVCQTNGTWSNLPTCHKAVICPVPSRLQNPIDGYPTLVEARIITPTGILNDVSKIDANIKILDGSMIIFDCAGGGYLQNKQTLYCHGTTKWIYSSNCTDLGLGIDCDVNETCSIELHSNDCVNRVCRCPLGMSYSYSEMRCVETCTAGYAMTFNEVKEVGQYGSYNIEILSLTKDECELTCLGRTNYTCRSFDYNYVRGQCFLQSVTYYDDPASVYGWSGGAYFLRDCL